MTPNTASKITQLLTLGRIDLVVLYLVVADMAIKPTGDDVGVLIGMALILGFAVAFFTSRARLAEAGGPAPAAAGQGLEPR
jgi:Tfp pilus assembly protein PilW